MPGIIYVQQGKVFSLFDNDKNRRTISISANK